MGVERQDSEATRCDLEATHRMVAAPREAKRSADAAGTPRQGERTEFDGSAC